MTSPDEQHKLKPIEQVLPSAELLEHYKRRIDKFEQERDELLHAVERCTVQQDDVHRLEWENRKRADEVKELQQALSDAQQFLFEERQRLLLLQAENDELKLQEMQDRKRIQQLLELTQPLEQTVTYRQDGPPNTVTALPKPRLQTQQQRQHQSGQQIHGVAAAGGTGAERVLRTVFLPSADTEFLLLKIESLQAQLKEQHQLHDERVAALLADRQLRSQEEERQRTNLAVQVEGLSKQVKQLEDALRITTRDYILGRREKQEAESAAAAAKAQMASEVSAACSELAAAKRQAKADIEKATSTADTKTREYVDKFRDQVRARDEELMNLASLHTATKATADKRVAELEARVAKLQEANRQLELRRQLDVDGWAADVAALRKTLAAVDRKLLQMRLIERLDDDERLDALLDQLERRMPGLNGGSSNYNSNNSRQQSAGVAATSTVNKAAAPGSAGNRHARSAGAAATSKRRTPGTFARDQRLRATTVGGAHSLRQPLQHQQQQQQCGQGGQPEDEQSSLLAEGSDQGADVDGSSSSKHSMKSGLAAELRCVRDALAELEARAGAKARRALAGV